MALTLERQRDAQPLVHNQAARADHASQGDATVARTDEVSGGTPVRGDKAAWIERGDDDENSPCDCATPTPPTQARGPVDTIGSGTAPTPGPANAERMGGESRARPGISLQRRPGIDSVQNAGEAGDTWTTRALLSRSLELTGSGADQQARFKIGDATYSAGQLRFELDRDPTRFVDFMRAHHISIRELNELLDDLNAGAVQPSVTVDLNAGSAIARQYRIGGNGGEVVDAHLDRQATLRRAQANPSVTQDVGLRGERAGGSGVLRAIGDSLAEAAGWVARLFGSSWNPDTITFNGHVDDAHFRQVGERAATGREGMALYALLHSHGGEAQLRQELMAQKPSSATAKQWRRAVDDYLVGARQGFAREVGAGHLPAVLSHQDAANALVYMKSRGFSDAARGDVARVLAQPEAVRGPAMRLLVELPQVERERMIALFTTPVEPPEDAPSEAWDGYNLPATYNKQETSDAQRTALFELMQRDGFQTPFSARMIEEGRAAVMQVHSVPEPLRDRYLALLPKLGLERAQLAGSTGGLAEQLQAAPDLASARAILSDAESRLGSSQDLSTMLGAGAATLTLVRPSRGNITNAKEQQKVVDAFESNNVRLRFQPATGGDPIVLSARGTGHGELSLARYFSDARYRGDFLQRTGMDRPAFEGLLGNVAGSLRRTPDGVDAMRIRASLVDNRRLLADPNTPLADRPGIQSRIREDEMELARVSSPANVDIDISAGTQLHTLFDLSHNTRRVPEQILAERSLDQNSGLDFTLELRGKGRRAQTFSISQADMVELIRNPGEGKTAQQAFEARYPGLNYNETLAAFAQLTQRGWAGQLPEPAVEGGTLALDFTRRQKDPALERMRVTLSDGKANNTSAGELRFSIGARSTADRSQNDRLITDSRVGGAAGNQWFQYGFFGAQGYGATIFAESRARGAFHKNGDLPNPAIALGAILQLDDFVATDAHSEGTHKEMGVAHGHVDDFLLDPRTGARAEGRDVQVLTFSGRGSSSDTLSFKRSSERVGDIFRRYGGVPRAQIEHHHNPTPERMFRAIEAELLHDPRLPADRLDAEGRTRPRTVVVHFAGHTASWGGDRDVSGFMLTGADGKSVEFTPDRVAELNRTAREQGVNLVWVADACRGGEYVGQARELDIAELDAAGSLPTDVRNLARLREGNLGQHLVLSELDSMGKQTRPMPRAADLAHLGALALRGGPGSDALTALHDRRDQVVAKFGADSDQAKLMKRYAEAIDLTIEARESLRGVAGLDPILKNEMITGKTEWRRGDAWMTRHYGALEDRITHELRERLPRPAIAPATTPTTTPRQAPIA